MMKQKYIWLMLSVLLGACTSQMHRYDPAQVDASSQRSLQNNQVSAEQKLGTRWGDDISSNSYQVDLKRVSSRPLDETSIRYADKHYDGRSINSISLVAGKVSFSVVDDRGQTIPLYRDGQNYYLSARNGQSYQLKYNNHSAQTFEIVASVDGLDVLNGRQASRSNSGYVIRPHSTLAIEGFRKSANAVASFTFSKPGDAYAANSSQGSIQNTGVIGTVVYELNAPVSRTAPTTQYAPPPNAFPGDR